MSRRRAVAAHVVAAVAARADAAAAAAAAAAAGARRRGGRGRSTADARGARARARARGRGRDGRAADAARAPLWLSPRVLVFRGEHARVRAGSADAARADELLNLAPSVTLLADCYADMFLFFRASARACGGLLAASRDGDGDGTAREAAAAAATAVAGTADCAPLTRAAAARHGGHDAARLVGALRARARAARAARLAPRAVSARRCARATRCAFLAENARDWAPERVARARRPRRAVATGWAADAAVPVGAAAARLDERGLDDVPDPTRATADVRAAAAAAGGLARRARARGGAQPVEEVAVATRRAPPRRLLVLSTRAGGARGWKLWGERRGGRRRRPRPTPAHANAWFLGGFSESPNRRAAV